MLIKSLITSVLFMLCLGCNAQDESKISQKDKIKKSNAEWKQELSPEEFYVLREKGTERAFSGKYNDHHEEGTYLCAACKSEIFTSEAKYDSRSGWPSFYEPLSESSITLKHDDSYGIFGKEVVCSRCESHLGHVFKDGPEPTGLRYCINSVAMDFRKK